MWEFCFEELTDCLLLEIEKHPTPYKIGWVKKGKDVELEVSEICYVTISIGKTYRDIIVYDVINMDDCHILLGRPWQYDVDSTYKIQENNSFVWGSRKDKNFYKAF